LKRLPAQRFTVLCGNDTFSPNHLLHFGFPHQPLPVYHVKEKQRTDVTVTDSLAETNA
jgi:hypothetical protein